MNAVSIAVVDAAGYVEIVEDPIIREVVVRTRKLERDDQSRVRTLVKAIANGSLSVTAANAAVAKGSDAVRALADRLAA